MLLFFCVFVFCFPGWGNKKWEFRGLSRDVKFWIKLEECKTEINWCFFLFRVLVKTNLEYMSSLLWKEVLQMWLVIFLNIRSSRMERSFGNTFKSFVYWFAWVIVSIYIKLALVNEFIFFSGYVIRMVVWQQGISCSVWMVEAWWGCPRKGMECSLLLSSCGKKKY